MNDRFLDGGASIQKLGFSTRVLNCLFKMGVETINDFANYQVQDLYKIRGIGSSTVDGVLDMQNNIKRYGNKVYFFKPSGEKQVPLSPSSTPISKPKLQKFDVKFSFENTRVVTKQTNASKVSRSK